MARRHTMRRNFFRKSLQSATTDRLAVRLRKLRLESLESRRLLTVLPFATFANDLQIKVATIQTTLDNALDTVASLKSLPFIGQQLGKANQVKAIVDTVGNEIQSLLTTYANAGPAASDLQNEIYQAIGPSGLNLLGGDNSGANNASTASDVHVSNFQLYGSGLLKTADVEMRMHLDATTGAANNLAFTAGIPSLPIQVKSQGGITLTVGLDFELAVDFNAASASPIVIDASKKINDFFQRPFGESTRFLPLQRTSPATHPLSVDLGFVNDRNACSNTEPAERSERASGDRCQRAKLVRAAQPLALRAMPERESDGNAPDSSAMAVRTFPASAPT